MPIVIKANGLAAGKGVYICKNLNESKKAVNEIFDGKFGISELILIEEFLEGDEMSYFIISDGISFKILILLKTTKELAKEILERTQVVWERTHHLD